jgi:hypothetical protein
MSPLENSGQHPHTAKRTPVLWVVAACAAMLAGARVVQVAPMLLPPCGLRTLTGIPCPFCGSTRALIAWSHLDAAAAIRWSPLVAVGGAAVFLWLILRALDAWRGTDWTARVRQRLGKKPWPAVFLGAFLLNWIYLMIWLPHE